MPGIRWLAIIPFLALIVGPFFVNRMAPLVLGLPFLLAWIVLWILLTSLIMAVIYAADPANREGEPRTPRYPSLPPPRCWRWGSASWPAAARR